MSIDNRTMEVIIVFKRLIKLLETEDLKIVDWEMIENEDPTRDVADLRVNISANGDFPRLYDELWYRPAKIDS